MRYFLCVLLFTGVAAIADPPATMPGTIDQATMDAAELKLLRKTAAAKADAANVEAAKQQLDDDAADADAKQQLDAAAADNAAAASRPYNWPPSYDPGKMDVRTKFVNGGLFGSGGIFASIDWSSDTETATLVTAPLFDQCTFEQKQRFTFAVYCYCLDRNPKFLLLTLREPMNNHEVGDFTFPGLLSMK